MGESSRVGELRGAKRREGKAVKRGLLWGARFAVGESLLESTRQDFHEALIRTGGYTTSRLRVGSVDR